jgi:hypothetical protein
MNLQKKIAVPLLFTTSIAIILLINNYINFNFTGNFEGIYLLKDNIGKKYTLSDHLFVGQISLAVFSFNFGDRPSGMSKRIFPEKGDSPDHLHYEWNPRNGTGFVSTHFPDGTGLVTYFGRYLDDNKEVKGLFVGGGLPETVASYADYNMNNSGMTYFNGKRWYHIWCSVNEGIGSSITGSNITPSNWEFIGSGVESHSSESVVISSSHKAIIDGVPVHIERRAHFTAGEPYFNLEIKITNLGTTPLFYNYLYGDEPWIGYYGTSLGDVGWVKDRIINYEEMLDVSKYSYIGMADIGNSVIGEKPVYTNLANFLEWFGPEKPAFAYFTNSLDHAPAKAGTVPLESNERFEGLQWERWLNPAESATIRLAVGMAKFNPKTGIPEKPPTTWK